MANYKLSLPAAIIININATLGAGIFINSVLLAAYAGGLCPLSYFIVGAMSIPLVIAFAVLLDYYEAGNFYTITKAELGTLAGFVSTWIFFISRAAILGLLVHFEMFILQQLVPALQAYSIFNLDLIFLTILVLLNLCNMRMGSGIQTAFTIVKFLAVAIIVGVGVWYFNISNFTPAHLHLAGLPLTIPIVLFAYAGFESTVSLSRHMEDPKRNAPRAVLYSFLIVVLAYCLYQLCYYAALNTSLIDPSATEGFNVMILFMQSTLNSPLVLNILHICMGLSALGATYGIMFSNVWNLYELADNNHLFASKTLTAKNNAGIAYWCLIIEGLVCVAAIFLTNANQSILQQIGAFGSALVYSLMMGAFLRVALTKTRIRWHIILAILSLITCAIYLGAGINGFIQTGPTALYALLAIIAFGIGMYYYQGRARITA